MVPMNTIFWRRLVIVLVVLLSINNILSAFAQTTILSPSCVADPVDPSKNILEITGNDLSSTIFNITSPINNCHVYIHDLTVTAINIASPTIKSSNITIRNVISGNKSIATLIWFKGSISNFSFINISNVSHSSLAIDASTGNDTIAIVKFSSSITGKPDISSTISISSLEMNNIVCDRTLVSSTACSNAMVYFGSITNFSSFEVKTLAMNNVTMISSSSLILSLSLVHLNGVLLFVQKIFIADVAVRNIEIRNFMGPCQTKLLNFGSTTTAGPQSIITPPEITIRGLFVEYYISAGSQGNSEWRGFLSNSISNYNTVQLRNVTASSVRLTTSTGSSSLFLLYFLAATASLPSPRSSPSKTSSSFIVDNIQFQNIVSSVASSSYSQLWLFYAERNFVNFTNVQFTSLRASSLFSSAPGGTRLYFVRFSSSVIGPPLEAFASPSTSFLLGDSLFENSVSIGRSDSQLFLFFVGASITNYDTIRFFNITASSLNAASSGSYNVFYLVMFLSSITARCCANLPSSSSTSTSFILDNFRVRSCSSTSISSSDMRLLSGTSIDGYSTVQFTNIGAISLNSTSPSADSRIYLLHFTGGITAPFSLLSTTSSTSFLLDTLEARSWSCTSSSLSEMRLLTATSVDGYNTARFTNVTAVSLNSSSSFGTSTLYLLQFASGITSSFFSSSSSLLIVDNIRMQDSVSRGKQYAHLFVFHVSFALSNYNTIQVENLSADSLSAISATGQANLYLFAVGSSINGPALSSSSSSLIVNNILFQQGTSSAQGVAQLWIFYVANSINNFKAIHFSNMSTSNVFASSLTDASTVFSVYFGGLTTCSELLLDNLHMRNISSNAAQSSSTSFVVVAAFATAGTYKNISRILLQNSGIDQITISNTKRTVVQILDAGAGLQAESMIINNNSLLLSSSGTTEFSSPTGGAAAVVAIEITAPGFVKMEVNNNILSISDDYWRNICAPANCSHVQVNDVQSGRGNANPPSMIFISDSAIVLSRSSFISFANYKGKLFSTNATVINFLLEDNEVTSDEGSRVDSLLGFDASPLTSPLPSNVVVDVRCNHWPRIVDRVTEQQLSSSAISSPSKIHDFINWKCHSPTVSESFSQSSAPTSSASHASTPTSSFNSSLSQVRTSESIVATSSPALGTETRSSDVSATMSVVPPETASLSNGNFTSTLSRLKSRGTQSESASRYKNPSPFVLKIAEAVNSALLASDGTQAAMMLSVAVFASISSSPALGFTIGRQQAMMDFVQKSLRGDCRGLLPATTVKNFEDEVSNPLGLGNSPTQLSIGGSEKLMSYYVGAVIGNCILAVGLVILNLGTGMTIMSFLNSRISSFKKFVKKNRVASMMKERCGGFDSKESLTNKLRRVFARSYLSLTLFFCLSFLLTPTLSSALIVLVAARNDPKLRDQQVASPLKYLSLACAIVFSLISLYFVMWSVKLRKKRKETYRSFKDLGLEEENQPRTFVTRLFKARGEWSFPLLSNIFSNNDKKDNKKKKVSQICKHEKRLNDFLIASPAFESYRTAIWFSIVEIATTIALAFPPFFAQFTSSAKSSCLIQGILLLIILIMYTTLLIWKNPFKLRILRLLNPILSLQQLTIAVMSLVFVATRNDNNDETPAWFWKILMIPLAFQSFMSVMMIGASVFPILMFLKKLRARGQRQETEKTHKHDNHNNAVAAANSTLSSITAPLNDNNHNNKSNKTGNQSEKKRATRRRRPISIADDGDEMVQLI